MSGANSGDLQGLLTFSNQQSVHTSGNAFADFLAGPANSLYAATGGVKSYTQDSSQKKYYNRYKIVDLYLQDDWKVHSRLTINAGLRVSLFGAWANARNTAYNWRPEAYNSSLGNSIYVDTQQGFLVRNADSSPVPLDLADLDPAITNGLVQCGANGVSSSCMTNSILHPAPRGWIFVGSARQWQNRYPWWVRPLLGAWHWL